MSQSQTAVKTKPKPKKLPDYFPYSIENRSIIVSLVTVDVSRFNPAYERCAMTCQIEGNFDILVY